MFGGSIKRKQRAARTAALMNGCRWSTQRQLKCMTWTNKKSRNKSLDHGNRVVNKEIERTGRCGASPGWFGESGEGGRGSVSGLKVNDDTREPPAPGERSVCFFLIKRVRSRPRDTTRHAARIQVARSGDRRYLLYSIIILLTFDRFQSVKGKIGSYKY